VLDQWAGLNNMGDFVVAGFWMGRKSALAVMTGSQLVHLTGLLGLTLLSVFAPSLGVLAGLFMLVFYSGEPFGRIPQPVLAERFSTLPTATAVGWYIAILAGSASIAGLLAGVLAQVIGYSAILWMAAAAFGIALLVNVLGMWPLERKKQQHEAQAASGPRAGVSKPPKTAACLHPPNIA
jgi:MFS family permease